MKMKTYPIPTYNVPPSSKNKPTGFEEFASYHEIAETPEGHHYLLACPPGFMDRSHWVLYGSADASAGQTLAWCFSLIHGHWGDEGRYNVARHDFEHSKSGLIAPFAAITKSAVIVFSELNDIDAAAIFDHGWWEFIICQKIYARAPIVRNAMIGDPSEALKPAAEAFRVALCASALYPAPDAV